MSGNLIGQKIRKLRELRGYTQEYMGHRLGGLSQNAYSRIESGEAKLDTERLTQIAAVLDIPIEELLRQDPMVIYIQHNQQNTNVGYNVVEQQYMAPQELLEKVLAMNQRLMDLIEKHFPGEPKTGKSK